jgi:hypothetical protein
VFGFRVAAPGIASRRDSLRFALKGFPKSP